MRRRRVRVSALVALVVVAGLVAFLADRPTQGGATPVFSPLVGTAAPAVVAPTLAHGRVSLASLRGHVVVLSFFASWCPPCRQEAPNLADFAWHVRTAHLPVDVVGVVYNDSDTAATAFASTYGLTFPVLVDPEATIANDFAVSAPPETVVLNRVGTVTSVLEGAVTVRQLDAVTAAAARSAA